MRITPNSTHGDEMKKASEARASPGSVFGMQNDFGTATQGVELVGEDCPSTQSATPKFAEHAPIKTEYWLQTQ